MNEMFNLKDYEIEMEPIPQGLTPRQFILHMTGEDFPWLDYLTWENVRQTPTIEHWMTRLLMLTYKPRPIILKKKSV